jgi:hypothetical protein
MRRYKYGQIYKVMWMHMNEAATGAVNVRYQQERNGHD